MKKHEHFHVTAGGEVEVCSSRWACRLRRRFESRIELAGYVAGNKSSVLARTELARDSDVSVRLLIASSPLIERDVLHELVWDESHRVRLLVAVHPSTSHRSRQDLFDQGDNAVLAALAKSEFTSPTLLGELSGHHNYEVRGEVALNPNTPVTVLELLASDVAFVRNRVAKASHDRAEELGDGEVLWLNALVQAARDEEAAWWSVSGGAV